MLTRADHLVLLDGSSLTIEDVVGVARDKVRVAISARTLRKAQSSVKVLADLLGRVEGIYGVNTGFGRLAGVKIRQDQLLRLQENLLRSHSAGVGTYFPEDIVRAAMLVRLNSLLKGFSGVKRDVLEVLKEVLNKQVFPAVPEIGSLGASGDLAPAAHASLVLIGEGYAWYKNKLRKGRQALLKAGVDPLKLGMKEGVALTNGTHFITGIAALLCHDSVEVLKALDIAAAMSMEALRASSDSLDEKTHRVRPHPGQLATARNMRRVLEDSNLIVKSKFPQDAYSLRCAPQIHGPLKEGLTNIWKTVEIEMNSSTDNPLVFDDEVLSGGNFHGHPIALALDILSIILTQAAVVSLARIDRLLNSSGSNLPLFLVKDSGVNSGLMIAEYTAAALVGECRVLAHPASIDNASVSAGQEDHASLGMTAANKTRRIIDDVTRVVAIELLCSAQALDFISGKGDKGRGTTAAYKAVREYVSFIEQDTELSSHINNLANLISKAIIAKRVEHKIGVLECVLA